MSVTTAATGPGRADPTPSGPVPRRVRPPRWLDLRLVLGVLLVLGSVLLGARVVTAADATVPVWSAAGDLAAGTVLTADDLVAVPVRLDDVAAQYLAASTEPAGRVLGRAVRAGELVPRSALEEATGLVQLALPVQAGHVPPSLTRGQVVDVYAVADPTVGATASTGGDVDLVVSGAPVQAVAGRGDGVLSTATTTVQVVVAVPADGADDVLGAIGGRGLVVVVRDSVDTGTSSAANSSTPAATSARPTGARSSGAPSSGAQSSGAPSSGARPTTAGPTG